MPVSLSKMARRLLVEMSFKIPEPVEATEDDLKRLRNLNWQTDLDWEEGEPGGNTVHLKVILPSPLQHLEAGIAINIQVVHDTFYQVHIALTEKLRGLNLPIKLYRSLVQWLGHIYSGKGRLQSGAIEKVWKELMDTPEVYCLENDIARICINKSLKNDEDAQEMISTFKQMGFK